MNSKLLLEAYDLISWEIFPKLVKELIDIDKNNIEEELQNLPSLYSYYYGLMSVAKHKTSSAESERDSKAASLKKEEVEVSKKTGAKTTDKSLEAFVSSHPEYISLNKQVIDLQFKYDLFKGLIESLAFKKDCLVQLSAQRRAEVKLMH